MEFETVDFLSGKLSRKRGQCESLESQMEVYLEVKPKKSMATSSKSDSNAGSCLITVDMWFHIAMYIAPEDVRSFALICRQTAQLVNSRRFWRNIYRRYCQNSANLDWRVTLPSDLQADNVLENRNCKFLRTHVIQALFYYHHPMKHLLEKSCDPESLLNQSYLMCWQVLKDGFWVSCYKFWNRLKTGINTKVNTLEKTTDVEDWETLVDCGDETSLCQNEQKFQNDNEGVSILAVYCQFYSYFPDQFAYQESRYRLKGIRMMLRSDMRSYHLELDLVDPTNSETVKLKCLECHMCKVLPWWHPEFHKLLDCSYLQRVIDSDF